MIFLGGEIHFDLILPILNKTVEVLQFTYNYYLDFVVLIRIRTTVEINWEKTLGQTKNANK